MPEQKRNALAVAQLIEEWIRDGVYEHYADADPEALAVELQSNILEEEPNA